MSLKMLTQKCIWMECGFVEYKLCDRSYDCENCPFDIAIKKSREEELIEKNNLTNVQPDSYKMISPDHIWILKENDVYTFGLDDFAQMFFNTNCSIAFPEIGSNLFSGRTFLWIIGSFGAIGFHSPIDGTVVWINKNIKNKPAKFFEKSSLEIELIKVKSYRDVNLNSFYTFSERHNLINQDKQLIKEFILSKYSPLQNSVTLPDGGEFKKDLLNELSNSEYRQLLKILFNKKQKE